MKNLHDIKTSLEDLRDNSENPYWNIHAHTVEFLQWLIQIKNPQNFLEVGTSNGYSALCFLEVLQAEAKFTTIESHKERSAEAKQNFADAGFSHQVEQIFGHAPSCFSQFFGKLFDFVFVDCIKGYYLDVWKEIQPYLSTGAILVFDNTDSHAHALVDFFQHVRGDSNFIVSELHIDDGLLLAYKK